MAAKHVPAVVNVHKSELTARGYPDFSSWASVPGHVYIGRAVRHVAGTHTSKWANPYKPEQVGGRHKMLQLYEEHLRSSPDLLAALPELSGADELGCWCEPEPCHGHVLQKLLRETQLAKGKAKAAKPGEQEIGQPVQASKSSHRGNAAAAGGRQ